MHTFSCFLGRRHARKKHISAWNNICYEIFIFQDTYLRDQTNVLPYTLRFCLYSYLYCTYFLIWFGFIFVYVYYKLFSSGLMLGFDPKCVIFRDDDIRVFPVSIICPSTLTELIRSISQDELAKFHKIA